MTSDCLRLREALEIIAATDVFEVGVVDGEVGDEHAGAEFMAVWAVAHKGFD